jgi:hypothetical protein
MSLQSFEAIYDHGILKWLGDQPADFEARVIVTILSETNSREDALRTALAPRRSPSPRLRGAAKMMDDLIAPATLAEEWVSLK